MLFILMNVFELMKKFDPRIINFLLVPFLFSNMLQYNTIQYNIKTYNAPYVTKMLFVGAEMTRD